MKASASFQHSIPKVYLCSHHAFKLKPYRVWQEKKQRQETNQHFMSH